MSDPKYLKCPCRHCGGSIEFPATGIGLSIACPHCHLKTTLFAPPVASPSAHTFSPSSAPAVDGNDGQESGPPPSLDDTAPIVEGTQPEVAPASADSAPGRRRLAIPLVVLFVLAAAGSAAWWWKTRHGTSASTAPATSTPEADSAATPMTPGAGDSSSNSIGATARVSRPKSPDDLQISAITLEKGKGNGLVHAVGTLRNNSEHQRFGLKLELELADAGGKPIGLAKDYRAVLEPHQVWTFRALVLVPKAVSARVSSLHEDE